MSDETKQPELRVLEFKPKEHTATKTPDNGWAEEMLEVTKKVVMETTVKGEFVTGLAIVYSTSEGITGCRWNGNDYVRLAGATSDLLHRLHHEE